MAKPSASDRLGPLVERVRAQAATFVACDGAARTRDPEAIHEMRVASRRLRSCLQTFRAAFLDEPTGALVVDLTWIGGVLGAARDEDVIARRIARDLGEIGGSPLLDVGVTSTSFDDIASDPERALADALVSPRYEGLLSTLAMFAITPPLRPGNRGKKWMVRRCIKEIGRAVSAEKRARTLTGSEREAALHEVRKAAKRARYAAETLAPVYGKRARRIASAFAGIQGILGEHHDASVTRAVVLAQLEAARHAMPDHDVPEHDVPERDLPEGESEEQPLRAAESALSDLAAVLRLEADRVLAADAAFVREWQTVIEMLARRWPTG